MIPITGEGAFDASIRAQVNQNFQTATGLTTGNIYYLDPYAGSDANSGLYPSQALQTLATAYNLLREGKNDVVVLIQNGLTTATARISSNFAWAKNAAHLIGVCPAVYVSQRARIAPTSGATAFANFFTVSGSGCFFSNIQWFDGFNTGTTAQICLTITGSRNLFQSCHLAGMGDAASAADAGSRSILFSAGAENVFRKCAVGLDTVSRTAANASVQFAGATARNVFEDCIFPFHGTAATPLGVIVAAAAASDRWQLFERCKFINNIKSASTQMSALSTLAASMGGLLLFKDCTLVGITEFGSDATSLAQIYVDGGTVTAATSGIAVNPS